MIRRLPLAILAAAAAAAAGAACRAPADAERLGDRAYAAGDFASAYTTYASIPDAEAGPDLLTKRGTAALRQGDAPGAIGAFARLAETASGRELEAAEGLSAAARLAASQGNASTLEAAVTALRRVAPERPSGRWVLVLARQGMLADEELIALAPAGVAAAPDPASGDSLLVAWAAALVRRGDCAAAAPLYRAAARRSRSDGIGAEARGGAAACALVAARRALSAADTAGALDALASVEEWAGADSSASAAAALAEELREAQKRLPPMDTTFFMDDR